MVADHVRSAVMLIEDGVRPGNEGGSYVLRRLLRRSIRNLRLLSGAQRGGGASSGTGFMHELTETTIQAMGEQFPELHRDAATIHRVIDAEDAAFADTLRTGTAIFDVAVEEAKRKHASVLSGAQAFQLHDTYGFPIDLTLEMAAEQGLQVDEDGFRRLMGEQRDRAKKDAREKKTGNADISVYASLLEQAGKVTFTGYDMAEGEATVVGLLVDGVPVNGATPGTEVAVVLDRTPFYAEGGGQLSDHGVIKTNGAGRPGRGPGHRRADPAARPRRAPRHGPLRRDQHRVARPTRRSTSSAGGRPPAATPRPTWCTARCAARSASRPPRRARRTRPAGCGSTSPRRARSR